jgi:hypothetical protein
VNLTAISNEEQSHLSDITELAVEVDGAAQITITDPMNREVYCDKRELSVQCGAKITIIENDKPLAVETLKVSKPFIVVRLDTFEGKKFSDEQSACTEFNQAKKNHVPVEMFAFNEHHKRYISKDIATVYPSP